MIRARGGKAWLSLYGSPSGNCRGRPQNQRYGRKPAGNIPCPDLRGADRKMFQICEITGNHIDFSLFSAYDKRTEWSIPFFRHLTRRRTPRWQWAAMQSLGLMEDAVIQKGLLASRWPGRMQEVRPGIYLDGAHNPGGDFCLSGRGKADRSGRIRIPRCFCFPW